MTSRILVVDDSPTLRRVVGAILSRHGYDVLVAADGQLAFELLTGEEPANGWPDGVPPSEPPPKVDLVLLDFVMPKMNGYQFCRAVRQKDGLAMLPVVLMSAKSDKIRDQFVTQTGAIDAISKPFDAQALIAVIENALRRVETGRASAARLPEIDDGDDLFDSSIQTAPGGDTLMRAKVTADIGAKLGAALGPALFALPPGSHTPEHLGNLFTSRLTEDLLRDLATSLREIEVDDASRSALSGDIAIIPIGAVMQMLQVEGQSGALTVWSGVSEITLTMRGGLIDLVQSRLAGDEFRLGRYFVEEGLVTPQEIDRLLVKDPLLITGGTPAATERSTQMSHSAEAESPFPEPIAGSAELENAPPFSGAFASAQAHEPTVVPVPAEAAPGPSGDQDPATQRLPDEQISALVEVGERVTSPGPVPDAASVVGERIAEIPPAPPSSVFEFPPPSTSDPPPASARPSQTLLAALPTSRLLGDVLVAAGRITEEQLKAGLVRQSSELVYEMLRWARGRFDFKRKPAAPLAHSAKLGLTVPAVVMEGFRRVDEWRALEVTLGSFEAILITDTSAVQAMGKDVLPRIEQVVLDTINGERTVREIIADTHMSSFDACRILVQLMEARLVRRRHGPERI